MAHALFDPQAADAAASPDSFWRVFFQQSGVPAVWMVAVLLVIGALTVARGLSWAIQRTRGIRMLPVVVSHGPAPEARGHGHDPDGCRTALCSRVTPADLAAYLVAQLSEDAPGQHILTPGTGGAAGPDPTPQAVASPHGWIDVVQRLVFVRPLAYQITINPLSCDNGSPRFSIRIVLAPRDAIVASTVMTLCCSPGGDDETVAQFFERIACFCTVQIRSHPVMVDRIPRWERWHGDLEAYRLHRQGVREQQAAVAAERAGHPERVGRHYDNALEAYKSAAKRVPGNLLVRHRQAAILELKVHQSAIEPQQGASSHSDLLAEAVSLYEDCLKLWPEHIESAYRLALAYSQNGDVTAADAGGTGPERRSLHHLRVLHDRLFYPRMAFRWVRTLSPARRNLGELHYWRAWLRPLPGPFSRSRRRAFRSAIRIAMAAEVLRADAEHDGAFQTRLEDAFLRVAREVHGGVRLRSGLDSGLSRMLYPDHRRPGRRHVGGQKHDEAVSKSPRLRQWAGRRRPAADWLVHYNAGCFLSLALTLTEAGQDGGPGRIPAGFTADEWREDCARAAVNQLNNSLRVRHSAFSPAWVAHDLDLHPLITGELTPDPPDPDVPDERRPEWTRIGREWAAFNGLSGLRTGGRQPAR